MVTSNQLDIDEDEANGTKTIRSMIANAGQNLQESGKTLKVAASKQMDALLGRAPQESNETPEQEEKLPADTSSTLKSNEKREQEEDLPVQILSMLESNETSEQEEDLSMRRCSRMPRCHVSRCAVKNWRIFWPRICVNKGWAHCDKLYI